jgi:hypothetical protein
MKRVREIAEAIAKLSPEEHRHLIEWFEEQHFKHAASARGEEARGEEARGEEAGGEEAGREEDQREELGPASDAVKHS